MVETEIGQSLIRRIISISKTLIFGIGKCSVCLVMLCCAITFMHSSFYFKKEEKLPAESLNVLLSPVLYCLGYATMNSLLLPLIPKVYSTTKLVDWFIDSDFGNKLASPTTRASPVSNVGKTSLNPPRLSGSRGRSSALVRPLIQNYCTGSVYLLLKDAD